MKINPQIKEKIKRLVLDRKILESKRKVEVFSASRLSDEDKKTLKKKLADYDWDTAEYMIDESLLAGVVVKVGSKVINLSLKGALADLKKIVYESN